MDWLLHHAERYRCHIQSGPFFTRLAHAERPIDLIWVHQLLHQSREFTQALCLRYSLCRDKRFQSAFAEHAFEEADHPDLLVAWMDKHGFLEGGEAGSVPATQDTINALAFCWRSAVHEPHDVQIVALNVLSEGVALDFFAAVIPVLAELDLLSGRYWKVHRDMDGRHLQLGLDRCYEVTPESPTGLRYQRVLWHAANLYHQMLSSWVGERVEQLAPMWTDNLQGRLLLPRARRTTAAVQNTNS
jgi:Iron-containing redox enzyme